MKAAVLECRHLFENGKLLFAARVRELFDVGISVCRRRPGASSHTDAGGFVQPCGELGQGVIQLKAMPSSKKKAGFKQAASLGCPNVLVRELWAREGMVDGWVGWFLAAVMPPVPCW